jgi:hypothetical protein
VVLGKVVDGTWYELANPRAADFAGCAFAPTSPTGCAFEWSATRIQCWIGDKAVANLEDGSLTTGHVGLTTFRSRAVFNSLKVSRNKRGQHQPPITRRPLKSGRRFSCHRRLSRADSSATCRGLIGANRQDRVQPKRSIGREDIAA